MDDGFLSGDSAGRFGKAERFRYLISGVI